MKNIILTILLLLPISAFSQVNIESIRNTQNEKSFWGEVKGGLELQRGNVNITSYDIDFLTHFKKNKHHAFLQTKTSKGSQSKSTFKNNSFVHLRWTWMTWDLLGIELFTQLQQDQFKNLEIRQLNGIGLRFEILNLKTFTLSLGTGAMTDYEKISNNKESTLLRSTSYLTFIKSIDEKKKNLILFTLYYQPLFDNPKDYRVNLETNVRTILISSWNIFIDNSVNYLYDTVPPEGINTNDLVIKTNITYTW